MDCIYRHTDLLQKKKFRKQAHYRETSWESCLDSFVYRRGGFSCCLHRGPGLVALKIGEQIKKTKPLSLIK